VPKTLKALIIEDSEDDALLVTRELRRGGFDVVYERVETAAAMQTALKGKPWDVVISDFTMPHFSGLDALKLLQNSGLDLPFLLVSGVVGEEVGVEAMRSGAHDYLMKRNLSRLVPAVERELREAETRRARSKEEDLLYLRTEALSAAANGIMITDAEGAIVWVNEALTTLTGYAAAELLGRNPRILKSGRQDQAFYANLWNTILDGLVWHGEIINRRKGGTLYTEEMTITPVRGRDGSIAHFIAVRQDVTAQRRAQGALQASEVRYRRLFEAAQDGILLLDSETSAITDVNPFLIDLLGYEPKEMLGKKLWEIGPFRDVLASKGAFRDLQDGGYIRYEDLPLETKSGCFVAVEFVSNAYLADGKKVIQCSIRDITERKRAEESLRETQLELAIKNRIANIFLTVPDRSVFGEVLRAVLDVTQSEEGIFGHFDEEGSLVRSSIGRTGAAATLIAETRTFRPESGTLPPGASSGKNCPFTPTRRVTCQKARFPYSGV
jgi:PAS domain S-box-containing protein